MHDTEYFVLVVMTGMPPWVCVLSASDLDDWKAGESRTVLAISPRSFQMQQGANRTVEMVIGPVYPMLTKQAELWCTPTSIEVIGEVIGEVLGDNDSRSCAEDPQLFKSYMSAVSTWFKEASAARAGITLAKPGDMPNVLER